MSRGQTTSEDHHAGARANSPVIVPVPVSEHRARLSLEQYDWPTETRNNPNGSPLLAGAGCLRGYADLQRYLVERLFPAELLETLDKYMVERFGPEWWKNTELEQFSPKSQKPNKEGR